MARKKIAKAPKTPKAQEEDNHDEDPVPSPEPQPQPEAPKTKKGGKAKKEESAKLNLFSDSFNDKVDRFRQFYEDFLVIRGGNTDADDELSQVTKKVSGKLEDACSDVLRNDLQDAERWIADQQMNIAQQINSTNKAIEATRTALRDAGTFTNEEIDQQVAGIVAKENNLKKRLEDFEALKQRAVQVYKSQKMDEE